MINNKKTLIATLTVFLIATATFATTIPSAQAQTTSYCFLSANPNPVGINQTVVVSAWINPIPSGGFSGSGYTGLHITIEDEDGNELERHEPARSDTLGATYFDYKFTEAGNYTIDFWFDGSGSVGQSSVPEPTILVVQEEPIAAYPGAPVTGDYWTRPIPSTNREWAGIAGDWLIEGYKPHNFGFDSASGFNPYSQAPRAPHIMWTKELTMGGLIGGSVGAVGYYPGLSYQPKLKPPLVINGRLYYNAYSSSFGSVQGDGFVCVDLRTGEEIYRVNDATITFGQTYFFASGNQMGAYSAFLYEIDGSTWTMFDAFNGEQIATFTGAQSSPLIDFGPSGEILAYYVSGNQFNRWNSTVAFDAAGWISGFGSEDSYYMPSGSASWSAGVDLTRAGSSSVGSAIGVSDGVAVFGSIGSTVRFTGYDINTGEQLYTSQTYTLTASTNNYAVGEGALGVNDPAKRTWIIWNTTTGVRNGESEPMDYPWGSYSQHLPVMAYGKMYVGNYAGELNAIDLQNASIAWTGLSNDAGLESPYGRYPFWFGPIVAGNVVFAATGEHSPTQPLIRGEGLYAFDATTGDQLWFMEGWWVLGAIADGYLVAYNAIDNRLYCIGKGPSATEVTISTNPIKAGEATMIQGTVTDATPMLEGTPAVADADMATWMEHKVMQQALPMEGVSGVPVQIIITYANGSAEILDYALCDMGGSFAVMWYPPGEGIYQVTAYMYGTDAYGSSYATTHIGVGAAAAEAEFPQYGSNEWPAYPDVNTVTTTDIAIIAVVVVAIVIGILNLLMLRKKK